MMLEFYDYGGTISPICDRDHILGNETAIITLVEYGDYQSPDCAQAYLILRDLQHLFQHQLRFIFRHFPQTVTHSRSFLAAEAAEAAAAQGKFWEMHEYLFKHQQALEDSDLVEYAIKLNLKISQFLQDMSGHIYAGRVQEDIESGRLSRVTSAPTVFVTVLCQGSKPVCSRIHRKSDEKLDSDISI